MRCQFVYTVIAPIGTNGAIMPVPNVAVTLYKVNSDGSEGAQATAYQARTGATPAASLNTDANGKISLWFEPGDYNIHFDDTVTPARVSSFQIGFSSVPWANSNGTLTPTGGPTQNTTFAGSTGSFGGSGIFGQ